MPRTPSYVTAAKHVTPEETPGDFAFTGQPSLTIYNGQFRLRSPVCSSRAGRAAKAYATALNETTQTCVNEGLGLREPVSVDRLMDALEGMRLTVIASGVHPDANNHVLKDSAPAAPAMEQSVIQGGQRRPSGPAPC